MWKYIPEFILKFPGVMSRINNLGSTLARKRYLIFNITTEFNTEAKKNAHVISNRYAFCDLK